MKQIHVMHFVLTPQTTNYTMPMYNFGLKLYKISHYKPYPFVQNNTCVMLNLLTHCMILYGEYIIMCPR
jgi:hypothetical protein